MFIIYWPPWIMNVPEALMAVMCCLAPGHLRSIIISGIRSADVFGTDRIKRQFPDSSVKCMKIYVT